MNRPFYKFHSDAEALYFYFDSVSNRRTIKKIVGYTPMTTLSDGYNLGFGDLYDDGTVDDISVSNNDDMEKVIATVVRTMFHFLILIPTNSFLLKVVLPNEHDFIALSSIKN